MTSERTCRDFMHAGTFNFLLHDCDLSHRQHMESLGLAAYFDGLRKGEATVDQGNTVVLLGRCNAKQQRVAIKICG